ncbi:MAG: hypothetical protein AB1673_15500 [Actinomycetota bacterium]
MDDIPEPDLQLIRFSDDRRLGLDAERAHHRAEARRLLVRRAAAGRCVPGAVVGDGRRPDVPLPGAA